MGDLPALAVLHGSDKMGHHSHAVHYARHLKHLRHRRVRVLEIGVGGYRSSSGGASLRMWRDYFPRGEIVGVDHFDKSFVDGRRIRTIRGDQSDADFLRHLADELGPWDVIVDDGSHVNEHVIGTFLALYPALNAGGVYAIEDVQTSYWPAFGGSSEDLHGATTMGLVKSLLDGLNHQEMLVPPTRPDIDRWLGAVHAYHNLVIVEKAPNTKESTLIRDNAWDERRFRSFVRDGLRQAREAEGHRQATRR